MDNIPNPLIIHTLDSMATPEEDKKIPITVVVGFLGSGKARFEYAKINL